MGAVNAQRPMPVAPGREDERVTLCRAAGDVEMSARLQGPRSPPRVHWRLQRLCPAAVPPTPSAGFNGICNRQ